MKTVPSDLSNSFYAVSGKMMVELADAIDILESWNVGKGLIIYGHGHNFCSGGDLNMARMLSNPDDGFRMAVFMQRVLHRLETLPLISVALIEGTGETLGYSKMLD
jgi:ethylmalonyl-CoA/methylmalonyl-CoA decarboxylase